MPVKVSALFWDNDGILVDTERLYFQANEKVLSEMGFALSAEVFRQYWLLESKGLIAIGERLGWSEETIVRLRAKRDEIYSELLLSGNLTLPGVEETLQQLPSSVIQAIVTSSKRDHFESIHRRTKLLPYFQFILAEGDYARSKPEPDPYLAAVKRSGIPPEQCLVIEDSERGLRSATAAGLRCWVIPSELTRDGDFSAAERVLTNVTQVLECF